MGGREVGGLATALAARLELSNAQHCALLREFWNCPSVPEKPGLKAVDLFDAVHEGRVKAVWIMATNPVVSLPDADNVRAALSRCELVVVSDEVGQGPAAGLLRLMETARHAWLLCVPCDALALPPTLAREMLDAQWAEEADIGVLHDGNCVQPACCLVPTGLAPDLRRYLETGDTALWRWQARHRVVRAHLSSPLPNINDAGDLRGFARQRRS